MSLREFFTFAFILSILVVQSIANRLSSDGRLDSDDEDGEYRLARRLFFHKSRLASTQATPSILENLIHSVSTEKPVVGAEKTTLSPSASSSDSCTGNPCENGGNCIQTGPMNYECKCVGPWRGTHCSIVDACYTSPCQNGGTCLNVYDDYLCKCSNEFYGTLCQNKFSSSMNVKNHCQPNTCHTGQCFSLKTNFYCECPKDRYGERCEKQIFKRDISKLELYQNLINQLKRSMFKQEIRNPQDSMKGEDVAYYDVKNGIYF